MARRGKAAHEGAMASRQQEAPTSPISVTLNGNRLTVIEEGAALRDALVRLIDGARTSLKLYYYIFADDGSGRLICERLVAARARGVAEALTDILQPAGLTPAMLKAGDRYVEDVY